VNPGKVPGLLVRLALSINPANINNGQE
jgi:hypothetical protein